MAFKSSTQDVADAINSIMRMDNDKDMDALLEVVDMYFSPPSLSSNPDCDRESTSTMQRGENLYYKVLI